MDTKELAPIEQAKRCLDEKNSFVMQGGAGSGKTETLKDLLRYMSAEHPLAKIVCITHTNSAADEIRSRINNSYSVSTIHSFLYNIIKDYKKNIKSVISELFVLKTVVAEPLCDGETENDHKKSEHEKYKKAYEKFANRIYSLDRAISDKVLGKRDYDKDPALYNLQINEKIAALNAKIIQIIQESDHTKISYNETKFNNFSDLSYGHDGLLAIAHLLFERFPVLYKIISDKYDYIFIDEYQDTRAELVDDLLSVSSDCDTTICLFGDTMQSIYSDGIGNVDKYTESDRLIVIPKSDNYRCSFEVIDIINKLRLDDIVQEVTLAKKKSGDNELESDRHGSVRVLYASIDKKPTSFDPPEEKDSYQQKVDKLITFAESLLPDAKILLLTNKAIAKKEGFPGLYKIFDDRYVDVGDHIDDYLKKSQIIDLCELCYNFESKVYNPIIKAIKRSGYAINNVQDKIDLKQIFSDLSYKNLSLVSVLELAFSKNIMKESESSTHIKENNERFLLSLKEDELYQKFKGHFLSGKDTYNRMVDSFTLSSQEEFDTYKSKLKKETFINRLTSVDTMFVEAVNYYKYINEQSKHITMHKTKGSSIDSVIVVLDEYFWTSEYDFKSIYLDLSIRNKKRDNSQKLIYVSCSRARKNLLCIKLVTPEEEVDFCKKFPMSEKIDID